MELSELAVMGGAPAFAEKRHVGRPNVGDRERLLERIGEILDRDWLTNNGPCVQEFEARLAELLGVRHAITMCNATVALEIAMRALGFSGEVITPSFTFIATAHALQWQEITPVFCDIAADKCVIDPEQIERHITPRTTGIVAVNLFGMTCDTQALADIAQRHNLKLLFDSAHAFACTHGGRPIGGFGDAEVFSFHATKFFNTFEGGAVTTNDDALAKKIRLMKNFGFAGQDNVIYIGTNGKMNEVSAAMGLTNLESLDKLVEMNRRNYHAYRDGLAGLPGVRIFEYDENEKCNFQYIVFEIDEAESGVNRDALQQALVAENVLARRYFHPGCHRMEPYRSYFPHAGLLLPNTERLSSRVLCLPTGKAMTPDDIARVCAVIRCVLKNAPEVSAKIESLPS